MRMPITILALWLPAAAAVNAADDATFRVKTTGDLVDLCRTAEGHRNFDAAMGYCLGFVDAANDYHRAITSGDLLEPIACPEHETTRREVVDMFLAWARKNGNLLESESPINGLMRAAADKWPCA